MSAFVKYQALGNDYLVVDANEVKFTPTPELVKLLCDRHFGVGGDGVLLGPDPVVGPEDGEPVGLRIFNSDGSECEKSGNGLRIFSLYLAERYGFGGKFTIRTLAGDSPVEVLDGAGGVIRVEMGRPSFVPSEIPLSGVAGPAIGWPLTVDGRVLTATSVSVGNPHTVVPLEEISSHIAQELGPLIARHPQLPEGTNVQFLRVVNRRRIEIEIWERGSGYTLASGSSSCAAASAARALGLVGDRVEVNMPGGRLQIEFGPDGAITMTGTAERVADGSIAPRLAERLGLTSLDSVPALIGTTP